MIVFDREHLDRLAGGGWLRFQRHPDADLWIYNYTEKTQYENYWTPETLACRGLILDADGTVVARPFSKFFNYGTPQAVIPAGESFVVTEKIDGSLGILYELDGEFRIASRGSFTSEQAREGSAMLGNYGLEVPAGVTPLFEIVYPANRIVVDYGKRRELVLLAAMHHDGRDAPLPAFSGSVARAYEADDLDALQALEQPNSEGFVVVFESGHRVKVKFAEYVRLHKIVTGVNARMIWEALRDGDDLEALLTTGIPDEIYQWVTATRDGLFADFERERSRAEAVFTIRPGTDDRKTLAQFFLAADANPAVLFRMLDGKSYDELIWKSIKPGHATPLDAERIGS